MAQKKAAKKKGDPTKPKTVPKATAQDSLEIYNSAKKVQDYYEKTGNYVEGGGKHWKGNQQDDLFAVLKEALKEFKKHPRFAGVNKKGEFTVFKDDYAVSKYHKSHPTDSNKFYQRETAFGILDTRAPMPLYDERIKPQSFKYYENTNKKDPFEGDMVALAAYDPIAIKPFSKRTAEEHKAFQKKYGKYEESKEVSNPKPSTTKPLTKTSETKSSNTKPKPKPTIPKPIIEEVKKKAVSQYGKIKDGKRIATSEEEYNKNAAKGTKNTIIPTGFKLDPELHELKKFSKGGSLSGPGDGKKGDPISKVINLPDVSVTAKGKAKRKYGLDKVDKPLDEMNKMFSMLGFTDKQYDPISNSWEESSEDWKKVQEIGSILSLPIGSIGTKDKLFKAISKVLPLGEMMKGKKGVQGLRERLSDPDVINSPTSENIPVMTEEILANLRSRPSDRIARENSVDSHSFDLDNIGDIINRGSSVQNLFNQDVINNLNNFRPLSNKQSIKAAIKNPDRALAELKGKYEKGAFNPKAIYRKMQDKLPGDSMAHYLAGDADTGLNAVHEFTKGMKEGRRFGDRSLSSDSFPLFLAQASRKLKNKDFKLLFDGEFEPINSMGKKTQQIFSSGSDYGKSQDELLSYLNDKIKNFNQNSGSKIPDAKLIDRRIHIPYVSVEKTGATLKDNILRHETIATNAITTGMKAAIAGTGSLAGVDQIKKIKNRSEEQINKTQDDMKKFNLGGVLQGIAPMVNIAAQAYNWGTQDLNNLEYNIPQMTQDRNPYMSHGGTMPGSKSFDGATHEEGGIPVDANGQKSNNPVAEVEHDEFMHKFSFIPNKGNYIFSKKLGTADIAEGIVDKYTKMKGYKNPNKDPLMKAAMEFELKNIADLNDTRKAFEEQAAQAEQGADQGLEQSVMRLGGILKKVGLSKYEDGGPMDDPNADPLAKGLNQSLRGRMPELPNLNSGIIPPVSTGAKPLILPQEYSGYTADPGIVGEETKTNPNLMDSGLSGALRSAVMVGDAFSAMRKAEKESPVMADYSKVNANLDSLSADLTPAKNAAASAFNEGNQQIRDGSTSLQSYMTRRMGSSAQQAEVLSQIAAKEREMKNAIHQTKAGVGAQIAVDDANRKYQNRVDNLMNKAAKEAFVQRLGDNMLGMAKAMDEKEIANLTIEEGNKYMKAIGDRYEVFSDDSGKITGYRLKYK